MNCSITDSIDISYFCMQIQIEPQEVTAQRLGRKIVHMKNSSKKNTPKTSRRGKIKHLFLPNHQSKTHLNAFLTSNLVQFIIRYRNCLPMGENREEDRETILGHYCKVCLTNQLDLSAKLCNLLKNIDTRSSLKVFPAEPIRMG